MIAEKMLAEITKDVREWIERIELIMPDKFNTLSFKF